MTTTKTIDPTIAVQYTAVTSASEAFSILHSCPSIVALDFEVASKYTIEEKKEFEEILVTLEDPEDIRLMQQAIHSDGLSHPSLTKITHLSLAYEDDKGFVFIFDNAAIERLILNWLVTTNRLQIWHNASFDFKQIFYRTGRFPKNYEDTMLMAKNILNHAENNKSEVGLKKLMGTLFGSWGLSEDYFTLEQMHNDTVLRYATTDACATFRCYTDLQKYRSENVQST